MNTLFKSKVSRKSVLGTAEEKIPKTIEIKSISHGKICIIIVIFSENAFYLQNWIHMGFSVLVT